MPRTVSEAFGVRASGGLHVPAARLWLDGLPRDGIAFRSHLARLPRRLHRVLCSQQLARLIPPGGPRPLTVPWATPFQLGQLAVELLPAGSGPGAALLRVHLEGHTVLYAAAARPRAMPTSPELHLEPADVLILDGELAQEPHLTPAALRERVHAQVVALEGAPAVAWLFDRRSSALDVARLVGARRPLYAHASIRRLARAYAAADIHLPRLRDLRGSPRPESLVLWPLSRLSTLNRGPAGHLARVLVAERCDRAAITAAGALDGLALSRRAAGAELDRIARASGAADVVVFGTGAAALCERLEREGMSTWQLVPEAQLPLV